MCCDLGLSENSRLVSDLSFGSGPVPTYYCWAVCHLHLVWCFLRCLGCCFRICWCTYSTYVEHYLFLMRMDLDAQFLELLFLDWEVTYFFLLWYLQCAGDCCFSLNITRFSLKLLSNVTDPLVVKQTFIEELPWKLWKLT